MTEQITEFETANLAKEKGFDWMSYASYNSTGGIENTTINTSIGSKHDDKWFDLHSYNSESLSTRCDAPTQSLLQKWLREKHNIHFVIDTTMNPIEWRVSYYKINNKPFETVHLGGRYNTYEEALEKGLQEALKLIKL